MARVPKQTNSREQTYFPKRGMDAHPGSFQTRGISATRKKAKNSGRRASKCPPMVPSR